MWLDCLQGPFRYKTAFLLTVVILCMGYTLTNDGNFATETSVSNDSHIMLPERANVTVITFGHNCCSEHKKKICHTAMTVGEVDSCYALGMDALDAEFQMEHKSILSIRRGAGLWLWKPYIIRKYLDAANEGDYIVYSDAGAHFVGSFVKNLLPVFAYDDVAERTDVLIWSVGLSHSLFCKQKAFELMDCNTLACHRCKQINAYFLVFKKSPRSLEIVDEWLKYCTDIRIISDVPPNHPSNEVREFKSHRHDQAVLTNVLAKRGLFPQNDGLVPGSNAKGEALRLTMLHTRL
eukprot:CFRG7201T1